MTNYSPLEGPDIRAILETTDDMLLAAYEQRANRGDQEAKRKWYQLWIRMAKEAIS
jgi:hypothetical protein